MDRIQISMEDVSFAYDKKEPVLKQISFTAKQGEAVGIIGANGVGKSTLLKLLVGLNMQYEGIICVNGVLLSKDTLPRIREKTGYVFQDSDSQLFMSNVYEDVAFAPRNYGLTEEEVRCRSNEALHAVHIEYLKDRPIYKLSGGEKKLASIAAVLSMQPDIILMDEPSAALDPKNRRNLIHILNGFTCLKVIASHDLDFIMDTCSRTVLMADGRIICEGETEKLLSDRELLDTNGLELPLSLSGKNGCNF